MSNVRLAGGHLFGKQQFVLSFFPPDVLDKIWNVIGSVSEGCLAYSFKLEE